VANPRRIKRLERLIQQVSAEFIQRELQDPRIGLVTLTRVKLSSDLSRCQLYWSCLGSEGERRTTERGLEDALASIQRAVAGGMQTRVTPRLSLQYDASLAHVERLETIFTQLRDERGEGPTADVEDGDAQDGDTQDGDAQDGDSADADAENRPTTDEAEGGAEDAASDRTRELDAGDTPAS